MTSFSSSQPPFLVDFLEKVCTLEAGSCIRPNCLLSKATSLRSHADVDAL